jgi:hypothetical protein
MVTSLSQQQLDQKRQIIETCLEQKVSLYQELMQSRKQSVADLGNSVGLDRQDEYESNREEAFEELGRGSVQVDVLAREIERLEALPQEEVFTEVQLGAVVKTDVLNFLVAVSQPLFQVAGEAYVGISPESPLFKAAQGLTQGAPFTANNRSYTIQTVF